MTSSSLLADRRMKFACALHVRGDVAAAIEVLEQALELAPDWIGGRFQLGEWHGAAGHRDEAVGAYRSCLEQDPLDHLGAVLRLALLGAVATPPTMPPACVAGVFDGYADRFDSALMVRLNYRVPADLRALVGDVAGTDCVFGRVLDLGCGTGLAGERFRTACAWLEGVDLSEGMVNQARRKAIYDLLAVGGALEFLNASTPRYDLILAADVLVYFGDLSQVIAGANNALASNGRLVFSTEATACDGYCLTAGQRYARSESYLRRELLGTGFVIEAIAETTRRMEAGIPLSAYLVVARKPFRTAQDTAAGLAATVQTITTLAPLTSTLGNLPSVLDPANQRPDRS